MRTNSRIRISAIGVAAAIVAGASLAAPASADGGEVNLDSYRQEFLIRPLLDAMGR